MGCDIHTYVEQRQADGSYKRLTWPTIVGRNGWRARGPFDWRNYGMFGFLADVRNYSYVPPISEARGLPFDISDEVRDEMIKDPWGLHTPSWLSIDELNAFDYERVFENRRCMKEVVPNVFFGGADAGKGNGVMVSYYDFLGEEFFKDLKILNDIGATRIVFAFDN